MKLIEWQFPIAADPPINKKSTRYEKERLSTEFRVENYPNPFNPTTVIKYNVPETGYIKIKIYDIMGKEITTLVDGVKSKGKYSFQFSMEHYHLSSGIYFCCLEAGKNIITTKLILSK